MKYKCEICSYIYDSDKGDPEYGFEAGIDLNSLSSSWVCPICGIEKDYFYLLENGKPNPQEEVPLSLMMMALTKSLWQMCGRGSCAVTREIGRLFIRELKNKGMNPTNKEEALELVKEYFIESNKFARDMDYHIKEDEVEIEIKNCRFFGLCNQLEGQQVLISTCPYSNTAAVALEEVTGYRYGIKKEKKEFGHRIILKRVSKINQKPGSKKKK